MSKRRILLIDDEVFLCKLVKLNIEQTGRYEVATAHSGDEGLKRVEQEPFDLVITDFHMPGMNGEEVLARVKVLKPGCPVVLFSIFHDDKSVISRKTSVKADAMISKPFDHAQLVQLIDEVLARPQPGAGGKGE